jgi:uncharacterized protein
MNGCREPIGLFVIKENPEDYIIYSPLARAAARVNISAAIAVEKYTSGEPLNEDEAEVIRLLEEYGLFDNEAPLPKPDAGWHPTELTLFVTSSCNLRCAYCYAAGGERPVFMPFDTAKAAVDFIIANALSINEKTVKLNFHGNGEPFMAFDMLKRVTRYAVDTAAENGLSCTVGVATNGVLSDGMVDFMLAYMSGATMSFDVLPVLQNKMRPFADGSGSYEKVYNALKRLDAAGFEYGIRVTLTGDNYRYIEGIVKSVKAEFPGCRTLHIEPAWETGRSLVTGERTPDAAGFANHFINAMELCGDNLHLKYSGLRQDHIGDSFCSVAKGGFVVTAEGLVTSCYEVCERDDIRAEDYIYGHYDADGAAFVFDMEKLNRLSRLLVGNIPYCEDCFCKWHCAGDCPAKLLTGADPASHRGSIRCGITKELTFRQIIKLID